jgi:hypothetical protein
MALTANTTLHHVRGEQSEFPQDAVVIYEGAMLGDNSGYARGLVAGDPFLGHAAEYFDNSAGAAGDHKILRYRGRYRLQATLTGVAVTDIGKRVFASADDTLTLTAGANTMVGVVDRYVTTNTAIVEFQTQEVAALASDLTALISNLATVTGSSDFTALQSDVVTLKSDNVVNKSNVTVNASHATALRSDAVVYKSDITVNASHATALRSDAVIYKSDITAEKSDTVVFKSDIAAEKSDTVIFKANRTKELKAISDAIVAKAAGDSVNASDLFVTLGEVLKAFSDALI